MITLADCTADPARLPPQLSAMWHEVWDGAPPGRGRSPNPSALYYRLLDLARLEAPGIRVHRVGPFGDHEAPPSGMPERVRRAVRASSTSAGLRDDGARDLGGAMGVPTSPGDDPVGRARRTTRDAYPLVPTRAGLVLLAAGASQATGIYRNTRVVVDGYRLSVCFYVDRSESMRRRFGSVRVALSALDGVPIGIRLFDERVARIGEEEFRGGRYGVGGWTSFDAVLDDFLDSPELRAAVVFTDGEADLDSDRVLRLRESGKALHGVLFCSAAVAKASPLVGALDSWLAAG